MVVGLNLHDNDLRIEKALQKTETESFVEPFSPKILSRSEIEDMHNEEELALMGEKKKANGLVSLGLWGLGIGLLSVLFAYKRIRSSNKKASTKVA